MAAEKEAVEVNENTTRYYYPKDALCPLGIRPLMPDEFVGDIPILVQEEDRYEPWRLPLAGTDAFNFFAKKSVTNNVDNLSGWELRIPRKHVIFPPGSLKATGEFERAIQHALQSDNDSTRFAELENVFHLFGYYYPYWIVVGGNLQFLHESKSAEAWLKSTETIHDLTMALDINPTYDLLEDDLNLEIQRIYKAEYDAQARCEDMLPDMETNLSGALVDLPKIAAKVGAAKGIHYDGSSSSEDIVELIDEIYVTNLLQKVSDGGKPRIEYMMRSAILGSSIDNHALLPVATMESPFNDSVFVKSAIDHHIKLNGGKLQPSTREVKYLVMYVSYAELDFDLKHARGTENFKEAVTTALNLGCDDERQKELEKVFSRFGHYYPSSISLGGRMIYKVNPDDPLSIHSLKDGVEVFNRLLTRSDCTSGIDISVIGGSTRFTDCQDWIESIKTNQARIQVRALRPVYELLDPGQRAQVLRLCSKCEYDAEECIEAPKGIHFDGMEAAEAAIQFISDKRLSKSFMLRDSSDEPRIDCVKRKWEHMEDIDRYMPLDIDSEDQFPGSPAFVLGSMAASKERDIKPMKQDGNTTSLFNIVYIIHKELQLYDEFIQASSQFKEAISKALLVGKEDHNTYYALQDVFLQFGYFYPSRILTGRLTLEMSDNYGINDHIASDRYTDELNETDLNDAQYHYTRKYSANDTYTNLFEETHSSLIEIQEQDETDARDEAVGACESEAWSAIGGDAACLLWNDVKGWVNAVGQNRVIIQRCDLKPMYELLEEEQRRQVLMTYNNIVVADDCVRYDYLLEMTAVESIINSYNVSLAGYAPTDNLFTKLLSEEFTNSETAIEFCKNLCADYGFPITVKKTTKKGRYCQWAILLVEYHSACWQFRRLESIEECFHNHELPAHQAENGCIIPTFQYPVSLKDHKLYVKLVPVREFCTHGPMCSHLVRYGDIVQLKPINDNLVPFIKASEFVHPDTYKQYLNDLTTWKSHGQESGTDILFESQAVFNQSEQVYLSFSRENPDVVIAKGPNDAICRIAQWYIQHINQAAVGLGKRQMSHSDYLHAALEDDTCNDMETCYDIAKSYWFGEYGFEIDELEAIRNFQRAADQGHHGCYMHMAQLFWAIKEPEQAVATYEKAALLFILRAYGILGRIYHTGYATANYSIPQNHAVAFVYYSIGGIFGDPLAALKIGEYLEKGYDSNFGIHLGKALRWYEYIYNNLKEKFATTAIGKIKHKMASMSKDTSRSEQLRREAFLAFNEGAMYDSYARFMVAAYHLQGWGCEEPDQSLGFQILLSLVESGLTVVIDWISKCYENGIGVEANAAKATAYRELAAKMNRN
ncbi:hypothetical protein EC973_004664 [Apophysomyces ossiformis]|uniref:MACPF-like domain-containing protein n=1 Tax=Apophysomyces ossiformis TaxID=679940 RepID=A0A8H7BL14_9FUNG|nr:hypothetical protein EC973_004664 [Apophysomyces ossiformis]